MFTTGEGRINNPERLLKLLLVEVPWGIFQGGLLSGAEPFFPQTGPEVCGKLTPRREGFSAGKSAATNVITQVLGGRTAAGIPLLW